MPSPSGALPIQSQSSGFTEGIREEAGIELLQRGVSAPHPHTPSMLGSSAVSLTAGRCQGGPGEDRGAQCAPGKLPRIPPCAQGPSHLHLLSGSLEVWLGEEEEERAVPARALRLHSSDQSLVSGRPESWKLPRGVRRGNKSPLQASPRGAEPGESQNRIAERAFKS